MFIGNADNADQAKRGFETSIAFMEKTRLWEALLTFDNAGWRSFERLVRSPYFNRKNQLGGLFAYLRTCRDLEQQPQNETAFDAAYPGETFDNQKLRLVISDLLALLEQLLELEENKQEPLRGALRVATAYRKRRLPRHARKSLDELQTALEKRTWRHAEYFEDAYALGLENFQEAAAAKRSEAFNLQELSDGLDRAFIARKLRHVCLALSHQAVYKKAYSFGLYASVMEYAEKNNLLQYPAIALYYHACRFLSDPAAESAFFTYQDVLAGASALFPSDELRALYLLAINFGVKKSNEGASLRWYEATFGLYEAALELELLFENGVLSRFAYHNIVGIAEHLGKIDWAETFIHRYKNHLERRYREGAYNMNLARVAYARKNYRDALLHLQQADYKDFINGMNARILQMKIYFETGETDLLDSHLDSMQTYLRRQQTAGYHRDNYQNCVRYTRAMLHCNPHDAAAMTVLKKQIEEEPVLTIKGWLLSPKSEVRSRES